MNLEKFWDEQSPLIVRLRQQGAEKFFQSIPNIQQAFQPADRWLRCIDEGCPGGVHLAGSGILLGEDEAAKIAQAAGVTAITSHEECGAAKLAAKQAGVDAARADEYGQEFAAKLAQRLSVSYCHLPLAEMARPAGLHIARAIYYDGTGRFDSSRLPNTFPPGFVISRCYLTTANAQEECRIALSIALGDHGFGERFTAREPMFVLVVADPQDPTFALDRLRAEVAPVVQPYGARVGLDGLVAPAPAAG